MDPQVWKQILSESDALLHQDKKPDLEIIFVRPFVHWKIPGTSIGLCSNPFGHLAIRYNYQGQDIVANIDPKPEDLVTFYSAEEYFFGETSPQKGISHRDIYGVRKYQVSPDKIAIIHHYLKDLNRRNKENKNKFSLHIGLFINNFHSEFFELAERGNCSYWTTKVLEFAGVIRSSTIFPKRALVNSFELGDKNTVMVRYKKQFGTEMEYGQDGSPLEITDYTLTGSLLYTNLSNYCSQIIDINPDGENTYQIDHEIDHHDPSMTRYYLNISARYVAPTLLTAYGIKKVTPYASKWADYTLHQSKNGLNYVKQGISQIRKVFRK